MALRTDSLIPGAKHFIRRRENLMIAMTGFAFRYPQFVKGFLMWTLGEKVSSTGMALMANKGD